MVAGASRSQTNTARGSGNLPSSVMIAARHSRTRLGPLAAAVAAFALLLVSPPSPAPAASAKARVVLEVVYPPRVDDLSFDRFWFSTVLLYSDGRLLVRVGADGTSVESGSTADPGVRNRPGPYRDRRFTVADVAVFEAEATRAGVQPGGPVVDEPCDESGESIGRIRRRVASKVVQVGLRPCSSISEAQSPDPQYLPIAAFVAELGRPTPFGRTPSADTEYRPRRYYVAKGSTFNSTNVAPFPRWPLTTRPPTCASITAATFRRSFAPLFDTIEGQVITTYRGDELGIQIIPAFPGSPHKQC